MTLGRYGFLLLTLIVVFAISPFAPPGSAMRGGVFAVLLVVLVHAVRTVTASRSLLVVTIVLGVLGLAPASLWAHVPAGPLLSYVAHVAFLGLVGVLILGDVLHAELVTMDLVLGASSIYLLMGLFWAQLFLALQFLQPGSFAVPPPPAIETYPPIQPDGHIIYFSYVTLATLGYGDVVPVSAVARTLAVLEALLGQLYLAILIARLVAQQTTARADAERRA